MAFSIIVLAPVAHKDDIMALDLPGGWGEPAIDARGLCAWGVDVILQAGDDNRPAAQRLANRLKALDAALAWLKIIRNDGSDWKTKVGWVEPSND